MKYRKHNCDGGLFDYQNRLEELKKHQTVLDRLNQAIDWEFFRASLEQQLNYSDQSKGGRPPYDPVFMFKIIVLQKYYGLSEENTEFQILDRFSFQRFLGLDVSSEVPDKNTVWVFKNRLGVEGIKALFTTFEKKLFDMGLTATEGKLIDATIVETKRSHTKNEEGDDKEDLNPGPRWTKKRGQRYFGLKNHVKVNAESKLIEEFTVTPADLHDGSQVRDLIDENRDSEVHADSAYAGKKELLEEKGIKASVNHRPYRNKPLTEEQKAENKRMSKVRARVEHVFGFQANSMNRHRLRTLDWERGCFQVGLGNLVYNLCRTQQLGVIVSG